MGRFLAIDYGLKRVGLAISDPSKKIAKAYKTLSNDSVDALLSHIKNEIKRIEGLSFKDKDKKIQNLKKKIPLEM